MIYVDTNDGRISIDADNNKIRIKDIKIIDSDNWGDEDCIKMVTTITECNIIVDKSIASQLANCKKIAFLRWNYYKPAYHIIGKTQEFEYQNDGSIIIKIRE